MEKPIRVALYGDSLFMRGIAKSLEGAPELEIVHIQAGASDASLAGEVSGASLLAFDIHEASPELMLALFKEALDLTLLALDPEGDRLLELSSSVSSARTVGDLMKVIRLRRVLTRGEGG